VVCSACNAPVFTVCYHCPGDRLSEKVGDDGVKRLVRDRAGATVVEWIYTSAELVETSLAPVPAVPTARIEGIRAALSAHDGGISPPEEQHNMNPKLLALLGLAATAGDSEVLSAVDALRGDAAELKIVRSELAIAKQDLTKLAAEKRQSEADKFISDALSSGRIAKGDEASWRALFELSAERAGKLMAERPEGSATPVGQSRQSATNTTEEQAGAAGGAAGGDAIAATHQILKANQIDPKAVAHYAAKFGTDMKAVAKHCAGQEVD
jgi:phage I-like protein